MGKIKFRRGQVWFLEQDEERAKQQMEEEDNFLYAKSRPYLIVSCQETLDTAGIINMVPLSLSADYSLPSHVVFRGQSGKLQVVCCEHVYTINKKEFARRARYMFDIPDSALRTANKLLSYQLAGGEKTYEFTDSLRDISNNLVACSSSLTDVTSNVKDSMDSLLSFMNLFKANMEQYGSSFTAPKTQAEIPETSDTTKAVKKRLKERRANLSVVGTPKITKRVPKKENRTSTGNRRKGITPVYTTWSEEQKLQFLVDVDSMRMKEVVEKYAFSSATVYRYTKILKEELQL